jgi:hypothetical protein
LLYFVHAPAIAKESVGVFVRFRAPLQLPLLTQLTRLCDNQRSTVTVTHRGLRRSHRESHTFLLSWHPPTQLHSVTISGTRGPSFAVVLRHRHHRHPIPSSASMSFAFGLCASCASAAAAAASSSMGLLYKAPHTTESMIKNNS